MVTKLTANIKRIYKVHNVQAPKGRGLHTAAFHRIVAGITKANGSSDPNDVHDKSGKKINPWAIAMKKLGPAKAMKKLHRAS